MGHKKTFTGGVLGSLRYSWWLVERGCQLMTFGSFARTFYTADTCSCMNSSDAVTNSDAMSTDDYLGYQYGICVTECRNFSFITFFSVAATMA